MVMKKWKICYSHVWQSKVLLPLNYFKTFYTFGMTIVKNTVPASKTAKLVLLCETAQGWMIMSTVVQFSK